MEKVERMQDKSPLGVASFFKKLDTKYSKSCVTGCSSAMDMRHGSMGHDQAPNMGAAKARNFHPSRNLSADKPRFFLQTSPKRQPRFEMHGSCRALRGLPFAGGCGCRRGHSKLGAAAA